MIQTDKISNVGKMARCNLYMLGVWSGKILEVDELKNGVSYYIQLNKNKYFTHPVYILDKDILEIYESEQSDSDDD